MDALDWLAKLVGFDTTSHRSNLALIQYVENYLKKEQIDCFLTYDANNTKANLFAILPAQNGTVQAGLVLSGHTDVVPVEGQNWDTDPFVAMQTNDKMYGRGTTDMKGFLSVMLALVPKLQQLAVKKPIYLAFSFDEEVGCLGARLMLNDLQNRGIHPAACIVGEPTSMRPVVAHKGAKLYRCRVSGRAGHSSLTLQGCNAIEYAAEIIFHLRMLANRIRQEGPFDQHFDVPFTTLSTNIIQGGHATNIIPALCDFTFDLRYLPEEKPDTLVQEIEQYAKETVVSRMQKEYAKANIKFEELGGIPSFQCAASEEIYQLIRAVSGDDEILKVAYGTEAGLFQQASIPTMLCGPGSIEQAHTANEYIALDQLRRCEQVLLRVVERFCGNVT